MAKIEFDITVINCGKMAADRLYEGQFVVYNGQVLKLKRAQFNYANGIDLYFSAINMGVEEELKVICSRHQTFPVFEVKADV